MPTETETALAVSLEQANDRINMLRQMRDEANDRLTITSADLVAARRRIAHLEQEIAILKRTTVTDEAPAPESAPHNPQPNGVVEAEVVH